MDKYATKVFLLHNVIDPMRLPIFEKLAKKVDLDVYFCMTEHSGRRSRIGLLNHYSFNNTVLENILLDVGDLRRLAINYTLLFRLLFKHYQCYLVFEDPPVMVSTLIVFLISKLFRKPFVLWFGFFESGYVTSWQPNPVKRFLIRTYRKLLYYYSDSFVASCDLARDHLIKHAVSKEAIFSGTEVVSQDLLKKPLYSRYPKNLRGKKIVLFVGYLLKRKGVDYLIRAFTALNRNNSVLIIAGAGPEENSLKLLADEAENIVFCGYVEGEEKGKYYSLADIFVLPTLGDAWGWVVNEAMYFGLPVIVTERAGCAPELVKDNGIIVPAGNVKALKGAMQKLLDNDRLRRQMGWKSKEYIKKYDVNYAVDAFVNAIKYVSSRKTLQ